MSGLPLALLALAVAALVWALCLLVERIWPPRRQVLWVELVWLDPADADFAEWQDEMRGAS